jgi:hypothetical protein
MHSLNVALVAALALRLDRSAHRTLAAGLAAVLFAVLPYGYQAVPWINVFFYPLNGLLQLGMALCYWEGRVRRRRSLLALAFGLCFLAPFEIEYGLLNAAVLLGLEVALTLQRRSRAIWIGGPMLALAFAGLFVLLRSFVPKAAYAFGPPTAERVAQILFYLLEAAAYPAAPLSRALLVRTGMNDLVAVGVVAAPILVVVNLWLARRGQLALLAAAFLWFGGLQLPGLVTLDFAYYLNSPRLIYPVGPSLAWVWGAFLAAAIAFRGAGARSGPLSRRHALLSLAPGAAVIALLLVVGWNVSFVRQRMEGYQIVAGTVPQLAAAAREAAPEESLLVVNMPSWLTPPERHFALGNNGVQFIPFYVGIGDAVFAVNDADHPIDAVQFQNARGPQPYFYGMYGPSVEWEALGQRLAAADRVYLAHYGPEQVNLVLAGSATPWTGRAPAASFDGRVLLELLEQQVTAERLEIELGWRIDEPIDDDLTAFVHLYGPDGALVAQDDGYPLRGLAPYWLWPAGQRLRDRRTLAWPAGAAPGSYRVGVGLYDPASGERLPATGPAGQPLPDGTAYLLEVSRP